jgi:hypothetical protein
MICVFCAVTAIQITSAETLKAWTLFFFWTRLTGEVKYLLCQGAVYTIENAVYETPVFSK